MQVKANHFTQIVMGSKSDKELLAIIEDIPGYDEDMRRAASGEMESRKKLNSKPLSTSSTIVKKAGEKEQNLTSVNIFIPKKRPEAFAEGAPEEEEEGVLLLPYPKEDVFVLASATKRFFNLIIDYVASVIFMLFVTVSMSEIANLFESEVLQEVVLGLDQIIGILWYFMYYIFFEFAVSGKTIGKMITRTRVVDEYGDKAKFINIVGRTLARLIPFEFLSFLGEDARGWHDSLSKTVVIDEQKSVLRSDWL